MKNEVHNSTKLYITDGVFGKKELDMTQKDSNLRPKCSKIQTLGQNASKYSNPRQKCCHDIPCFGIKVFKFYQPELKKKKPHMISKSKCP